MAYLCYPKHEKYSNKERKVNRKPLTSNTIIQNIFKFINNIKIFIFKKFMHKKTSRKNLEVCLYSENK